MKRLLLLVIVALLFIPIISPTASASGGSWNVTSKPLFAFSGDTVNVTVTVSGSPDRFGFVDLVAPNGTVISEEFFTADEMGSYSFNLTLPYWLKSGDYTLSVVAGGIYVANATLNVTLDQLIYRKILDQMTNDRIARDEILIQNLNILIMQEIKLREDSMLLLELAGGLILICAVFMVWQWRPYINYRLANAKGNGKIVRSVRGFAHPEPDCEMPHIDGVQANRSMLLRDQLKDDGQTQSFYVKCNVRGEVVYSEPVEEVRIDSPKSVIPSEDGVKIMEPNKRLRRFFRMKDKVMLVIKPRKSSPQVQEQVTPEELAEAKAVIKAVHEAQDAPKKVVIQKRVIVQPTIAKPLADEWDLSSLPKKMDILSEKPVPPEPKPMARPASQERIISSDTKFPIAFNDLPLASESAAIKTGPVKVLTEKERMDADIASLKAGVLPAYIEPITIPWNSSIEYALELQEQARKEHRKVIVEKPPKKEVAEPSPKKKRSNGRKGVGA